MIDKLKDKLVLSDELSKHLKLTKRGNLSWALCPFHDEITPSFVINDEKHFYYCFGCGEFGDIFKFYKNILNKTFQETLKELSEKTGIKIFSKAAIDTQEEIEKILEFACSCYQRNLTNNTEIYNYLINRKVEPEMIEKFRLGYADESLVVNELIQAGFKSSEIRKSGISSYNSMDKFRNRIIFPILDKNAKVIGFSGRVIDDSLPKYLNSPETELFHKKLHLFNENNLKPSEPIILVEGYMDVITMTQYGYINVVASMGTSLSPGQVLSIFKMSNTLYLMFDGDKSGQDAAARNILVCLKVATFDSNIQIITLPFNKDPDSILKSNGKTFMNDLIQNSVNVLQWQWKKMTENFKNNTKSLAKLYENIEEFLGFVNNKNLKKAYKTFFDQQIFKLKTYKKYNDMPKKTINAEDIVITLLAEIPEFIEIVIEDLMAFSFQNKNYEKIRLDLIEKVTVENLGHKEIHEFLLNKYEKILKNLLNQKNLSYIIHSRDFTLQYLKDTLYVLMRSDRKEATYE